MSGSPVLKKTMGIFIAVFLLMSTGALDKAFGAPNNTQFPSSSLMESCPFGPGTMSCKKTFSPELKARMARMAPMAPMVRFFRPDSRAFLVKDTVTGASMSCQESISHPGSFLCTPLVTSPAKIRRMIYGHRPAKGFRKE